ncbi:hypothetical protein HDV05_002383 [Chytridiales sp. JEL 0842]|nr:hypothetical protein HDV05_002383 [Chytridiales sp. JEL 0842]
MLRLELLPPHAQSPPQSPISPSASSFPNAGFVDGYPGLKHQSPVVVSGTLRIHYPSNKRLNINSLSLAFEGRLILPPPPAPPPTSKANKRKSDPSVLVAAATDPIKQETEVTFISRQQTLVDSSHPLTLTPSTAASSLYSLPSASSTSIAPGIASFHQKRASDQKLSSTNRAATEPIFASLQPELHRSALSSPVPTSFSNPPLPPPSVPDAVQKRQSSFSLLKYHDELYQGYNKSKPLSDQTSSFSTPPLLGQPASPGTNTINSTSELQKYLDLPFRFELTTSQASVFPPSLHCDPIKGPSKFSEAQQQPYSGIQYRLVAVGLLAGTFADTEIFIEQPIFWPSFQEDALVRCLGGGYGEKLRKEGLGAPREELVLRGVRWFWEVDRAVGCLEDEVDLKVSAWREEPIGGVEDSERFTPVDVVLQVKLIESWTWEHLSQSGNRTHQLLEWRGVLNSIDGQERILETLELDIPPNVAPTMDCKPLHISHELEISIQLHASPPPFSSTITNNTKPVHSKSVSKFPFLMASFSKSDLDHFLADKERIPEHIRSKIPADAFNPRPSSVSFACSSASVFRRLETLPPPNTSDGTEVRSSEEAAEELRRSLSNWSPSLPPEEKSVNILKPFARVYAKLKAVGSRGRLRE